MKPFVFTGLHIACVFAFVGILAHVVCRWYQKNFYAEFEEVLVTITSPLKGSDTTAIKNGFRACFMPVVLYSALFTGTVALYSNLDIASKISGLFFRYGISLDFERLADNIILLVGFLLFITGLILANRIFNATGYIGLKLQSTDIYEKHYTDPEKTAITPTDKKRNLIWLYLESMETSYASTDKGGKQQENYIPHLIHLAEEETNFSENGLTGGFHNTAGSSWTAGALFSSTAGIPSYSCFKSHHGKVASNLTCLYDVLDKEGYNQYYICGSDAHFGGRSDYYRSHGDVTIYDVNTAKKEGCIPEDYHVWWGMEDAKMYAMAKDKILDAAEKDEPFSFTMLTVDTHFPKGYRCQLCQDEYDNDSANIIKCADRQAAEFIDWCRQQDFYKDTLIVVSGDHPRMDKVFPAEMTLGERTTYLAFVNSAVKQDKNIKRCYTQLDIFPTTLAAMGYKIDGDRLGLGTNLFSDKATLAESMGFEKLNEEMGRRSSYVKNFR